MNWIVLIFWIVVIGGIAAQVVIFIYRSIKDNKRLQILFDNDPDGYILEMKRRIEKDEEDKKPPLWFWYSNLAVAYSNKGEFVKAIELLKAIPFDEEKNHVANLLTAFNISNISFKTGDYKTAMMYYEKLKAIRGKISAKRRLATADMLIAMLQAEVDFHHGNYDAVMSFCKKQLESESDTKIRAFMQFLSARVYEKIGDTNKQIACLEYVAEHSNVLYIANDAREKLRDLKRVIYD